MKRYLLSAIMMSLSFTACNQASDIQTNNTSTQEGATRYSTLGCNACHGDDGKTAALGVSRIISDIDDARDIQNALYTLKHATTAQRDATMVGIATNLSDEDILILSDFIATL